jgi:3-oxoacyl-[acyl-carrier protein] reductase
VLRSVAGKAALITGAGRGIGRAIARVLAEEGCDLALVSRTKSELEETAGLCANRGVQVITCVADVTDRAALSRAFKRATATLKGLDILVNNAGTGRPIAVGEADWDEWSRMIDVNLKASMEATRLAVPHLMQRSNGTIVFIASVSARITYAGGSAYCASKHGILGFAGAVFEDVRRHGVRVCSICPGLVNTGLVEGIGADPKAIIQPEDVAEAVRFVVKFPGHVCPTEIVLRAQMPPWV